MSIFDEQDLHRLVKHALDTGAAATIGEAEALFRSYAIDVTIERDAACEPEHQMALLTLVALGRRVFHGGVHVHGALDVPLRVPLTVDEELGSAVVRLGGVVAPALLGANRPLVSVGGGPRARTRAFHLRIEYAGWRGGVVPADLEGPRSSHRVNPLAPMLGAALAVSEAYAHLSGEGTAPGRRALGLSAWAPQLDWLEDDAAPELEALPSRLWVIGLGHLGQAFLWALGLLPYSHGGLELVLQDTDTITRSTESTSVLTDATLIGTKKARAMASWCERRGFATAIYERAFDATFRRQEADPAIAFCGVDNALARRALDGAGFPLVVEAGLGRGHRDFRTMRLHTLPGSRTAAELWVGDGLGEDVTVRAAYQRLLDEGRLDRCGVTLLAGKAVGAPFVGAVAAALGLGEVLRLLHGRGIDEVIDLDLRSIEHRSVVASARELRSLNPGFSRPSAAQIPKRLGARVPSKRL